MVLTKQIASASFVLWLVWPGVSASGETIIGSEYFPLQAGNFWTYKVAGPFGKSSFTETVLPGTQIVNGVETRIIEVSDGDFVYGTSDTDGVRIHGFHYPPGDFVFLDPPLVRLKGMMTIPDTFTVAGKAVFLFGSQDPVYLDYTYRVTLEDKEVITVPAGTYETLKTDSELRIFGSIAGEVFDETQVGTEWLARHIGDVKGLSTDSDGITESELVSTNVVPPVDLSGTIKTPDGTDICAMVLASGQYTFSCDPPGVFSLTGLPRETDGTVKRQIYADGFFPKIDVLPDSTNEAVVMTRSGACPDYNFPYDPATVPGSAGEEIDIAGDIFLQDSQTPICAMVLASGKFMFSCDGTGSYSLKIPLDKNGQFKLQVYADGFAPSIQTFDEYKTTNDVRMARAVECQ